MTASRRPWRPYHLLAVLPVVALVGAPWFANRVEPYVLGMPFLLAWIAGWVAMSTVVMAIISACDRARHAHAIESPPDATRSTAVDHTTRT